MRVLLLLRGSAGCGKSTWIEQNGLKPYTLSADDIRLLCASPVMTVDGGEAISQSNDNIVWKTLSNILETRMKNGEFTVIDATNSKTSEMNRYKKMCEEYKYRIYCVDFTNIPIEETKRRNLMKPALKQVPEYVIDKMYARFETQKIPSGITVISPNELNAVFMKRFDMSEYKKIHHIGDIHGCYTALKEYFDLNGGIKDDEFYIFCGDYIDRGIENAEVIKFLLSIYKKPNVLLLEGNHERWLWCWANDKVSNSKEFELHTKAELESAGISKKDVRMLYRRLGQCAHYEYKGRMYLVTHAGLSNVSDNLTFIATNQMIRGVGNYNDFDKIADSFVANTPDNYFQIHGHRNTKGLPVQVNSRVFNLEGRVEFGGDLRCVQVLEDGMHNIVEVKNDVYKEPEVITSVADSVGDLIIALRSSNNIMEKKYGNISSFNFTKTAFYDAAWDEMTTKARGLYINIPRQKIVARAYDKFFNVNERPETEFEKLQDTLTFPVTGYVKENGYLGIVSCDEENDSLFVTTKSNPTGDFAVWLREALEKRLNAEKLGELKEYTKANNVSFVFENVDMERDPHIIDYPESKLILLDIIYNDIEFKKYDYEQMCAIAERFGFECKERACTLANWQEFYDWYNDVTTDDYRWNGRVIEGFVIEDAKGYMVKKKLTYYNFWKFMRSISNEAIRKGYIDPKRTSALVTPLANKYYAWVRTLHDVENPESVPRDICTLRRMFFETEEGKAFRYD